MNLNLNLICSILVATARAIIDQDLTVSKEAKMVLYALSEKRMGGVAPIFDQPLLPLFQEMSRHEDETLRLRIFEFVVHVSKLSTENMRMSAETGFLQDLCRELDKEDDVLLQLNVLEILVDLAESPDGYLFLEERQMLQHFDKLLSDCINTPTGNFLLPGYIKFFGRIANRKPVDFADKFPNFTSTLFTLLQAGNLISGDEELRNLAIATVGHIGLTLNGKRELNKLAGDQLLQILVHSLTRGTDHQRVTALNAVSDILSTKTIPSMERVESLTLTENFFQLLNGKGVGVKVFFEMIKQPFADISMGAYEVLSNLSDKPWGLRVVLNQPGLAEFLLNRSTAPSKEAKETKYNLIKTMIDNDKASEIIPPEIYVKFKLYVKEGPYYVDPQVEVALDEG